MIDYVVIGAGPAGIAAARTLKDAGKSVVVFEQQARLGGLCGSFDIQGCTFDKFVHLSFAPDELRNKWFNGTELTEHSPLAYNYFNGKWLKHPAVNNLANLPLWQKSAILASFANRQKITGDDTPDNYNEWSNRVYGKYFTKHFVEPYTQKYWGVSTRDLNTSWVGPRFHKPTFKEVISGAMSEADESFFYAKKVYYPKRSTIPGHQNGYVQILDKPSAGLDIRYNQRVTSINPIDHNLCLNGERLVKYGKLISTMPLPEIITRITTVNSIIAESMAKHFRHTTGVMISLVFDHPKITDKLWFYVYDLDIPPARFYSPSICCPENVARPGEQSTLQGEIFFAESGLENAAIPSNNFIRNRTIGGLKKMGFDITTLEWINVRREKYANIIFGPGTDEATEYAQAELDKQNIISCGRFGEWKYLWSHQAFQSGIDAANKALTLSSFSV